MTSMHSIPARLRVVYRPQSTQALLLRRGPSQQVLTIGWDRSDDTFTLGQWLKGVIYLCDLSPDGTHWIYGASNRREAWTAVARVPWLKAEDFYRHGGSYTWGGGGQFLSDKEYWLFTGPELFAEARKQSTYIVKEERDSSGDGIARWERDGWKPRKDPLTEEERRSGFHKRMFDDWYLHISFRVQRKRAQVMGKGYCYDHYSLRNKGTGEVINKDWDLADYDGNRLLWTDKGKLYAGNLSEQGAVVDQAMLFDANPYSFTERIAPY